MVKDKDGSHFDVLTGGSYFIASLALVLDEVVRRYTKDAPAPDGILVTLPHRHQLAFHVIRDRSVAPHCTPWPGSPPWASSSHRAR